MKRVLLFAVFLLSVFMAPGRLFAQEKIDNFRSTIHINADGTINIEEKIVYDFGFTPRHGIFRDIPYTITHDDGRKFTITLDRFSVADQNGKKYKFEKSSNGGQVRLKIGDPDKTVTGQHTYVIKYRASGGLRYFENHDELYWNINGTGWGVATNDVQATVVMPKPITGADLKLACYTGPQGATEAECTFNTDQNNVYFAAKRGFDSYEGMTIVVGFPKGMVQVLEPKPVFSQTPLGKFLISLAWGAGILAAIFWYIIYPAKIVIKWFRSGRDPKGTVGEVRAGFDPPKGKDGEPLTPSETGAILDEDAGQREISALLVDLARRGHLRIEERKRKDFYFVETASKEKKKLLQYEQDLLDGIFATGKEVRLKDLKYKLAATTNDIKKAIYERLVANGFFAVNPEKTRNFYTGMMVAGVFTVNLPLALAAGFFGRQMPQKTVAGSDAKNSARSLKNFLTSQERQLEFQAKNQLMFEKLLPFAVAFGVEEIWAKRFEGIDMQEPGWYSGYSGSRFSSTYLSSSLHSSFGGLATASSTPSSSGGSGFSGGSSGGGGGGGGGGSW